MSFRDPPEPAAVVLAAGGSSRLGAPKQLLAWHGVSLARREVLAALGAGCRPVYVVVGSRADDVRAEVVDLGAEVVENPTWEDGLASSIAAGVRAARTGADPGAVLLMLVDQPHVTTDVLARLLAAFDSFDSFGGGIAASRYAGTLGAPAVFGRADLPALECLRGDRGARSLLESESERVVAVDFEAGIVDIDTPEDWDSFVSFAPRDDPP